MLLVVEIIGIFCMLTFMFVAIWGFILQKQFYSQMRYQNYLLEKLTQNIYMLAKKDNTLLSSSQRLEKENSNTNVSTIVEKKENLNLNNYAYLNDEDIEKLQTTK